MARREYSRIASNAPDPNALRELKSAGIVSAGSAGASFSGYLLRRVPAAQAVELGRLRARANDH